MLFVHVSLTLRLILASQFTAARLLHSLPEDTFAFPKFHVTFLNGLPVLNETAQSWLKDGLRGGELEFLGQALNEEAQHNAQPPKVIGSGDGSDVSYTVESDEQPFTLKQMKIGPRDTYLCLIPKIAENPPPSFDVEPEQEVTPVHSWSLLQELSGRCLYHRQGWFTYSYCHNEQIRQFKELPHAHPHPPGGYTPEEDPQYISYTLGRAPSKPEAGADLSVAEQSALAANVELARGAGSLYLVQRWGDGTVCDKTGKNREVEVQFHCSMTVTDSILFVKEAKTCSYVLLIHTPRLCGLPGFKSQLDSHTIRCREVVESAANAHPNQEVLEAADYPYKLPRRKPAFNPPVSQEKDSIAQVESSSQEKLVSWARQALQMLTGNADFNLGDGDMPQLTFQPLEDGGGEVVIEFLDNVPGQEDGTIAGLADIFRQAGFQIKGEQESHSQHADENSEGKDSNTVTNEEENARDDVDEL